MAETKVAKEHRKAGKDKFLLEYATAGSLVKACKNIKVGIQTVYDWFNADADFKQAYENLKEVANLLAADDLKQVLIDVAKAKGGEYRKHTRAQITSAIFMLKALDPRTYVEKLQLQGVGDDGLPVAPVQVLIVNPRNTKLSQGKSIRDARTLIHGSDTHRGIAKRADSDGNGSGKANDRQEGGQS